MQLAERFFVISEELSMPVSVKAQDGYWYCFNGVPRVCGMDRDAEVAMSAMQREVDKLKEA